MFLELDEKYLEYHMLLEIKKYLEHGVPGANGYEIRSDIEQVDKMIENIKGKVIKEVLK